MRRGAARGRPIGGIAALAGLVAGLLAVMLSHPVAADVPTPTGFPKWTQGADGTYKWGENVLPPWDC